MVLCKNCGGTFDESEFLVVREDPSPRGISLPSGEYSYCYCPYCGDDDYETEFSLLEAIDLEEGEDELSVVVSYRGKQIEIFLDRDGQLEGRHISSKGSALIKRLKLSERREVSA